MGRLTDDTAEAEVASKSLKIAQRFEAPVPGPELATFGYSTTLDLATITERLQQTGFPVIGSSPGSITWGLGLPKHNSFDYASATLSPGSVNVNATISSQSATARRMAHADLRYLADRIQTCLRSKDASAEFRGPQELVS